MGTSIQFAATIVGTERVLKAMARSETHRLPLASSFQSGSCGKGSRRAGGRRSTTPNAFHRTYGTPDPDPTAPQPNDNIRLEESAPQARGAASRP